MRYCTQNLKWYLIQFKLLLRCLTVWDAFYSPQKRQTLVQRQQKEQYINMTNVFQVSISNKPIDVIWLHFCICWTKGLLGLHHPNFLFRGHLTSLTTKCFIFTKKTIYNRFPQLIKILLYSWLVLRAYA